MNSLFYSGLTVQPLEMCDPICNAIVLTGTCDIPAKITALNMIEFFACPYCEQPGRALTVGSGCVRVYPYHKGVVAPLYIGMVRVGQHRSHTFAKSAFP